MPVFVFLILQIEKKDDYLQTDEPLLKKYFSFFLLISDDMLAKRTNIFHVIIG